MRKFNALDWLQAVLLVCLISVTPFALSQSGTTKQKPASQEPSATDSSTDTDTDADSGKKKDHAKGTVKGVTAGQQSGTTSKAAPAPAQPAPGKQDTKNVADGAAKGQASEGVAPNPNGGTGKSGGIVKERDMSSPGVAVTPGGHATPTDKARDKEISDGAAKGQAQEGVAPNPKGGGGNGNPVTIKKTRDMGSPTAVGNPNGGGKKDTSRQDPKNISDGAAKGQAVDGMAQNPNSKGNGKSSTSIISVDGLEHSHETVNDKAAKPHPVGGGGTDNPVESKAAQAPKGKTTATGTTDTTTKSTTDNKKN